MYFRVLPLITKWLYFIRQGSDRFSPTMLELSRASRLVSRRTLTMGRVIRQLQVHLNCCIRRQLGRFQSGAAVAFKKVDVWFCLFDQRWRCIVASEGILRLHNQDITLRLRFSYILFNCSVARKSQMLCFRQLLWDCTIKRDRRFLPTLRTLVISIITICNDVYFFKIWLTMCAGMTASFGECFLPQSRELFRWIKIII